MSGDMTDTLGLLSDAAGIIPRVLNSLFRKLDADEMESSVKCSFIELYNEELRDLLSVEENAKLKIFDDAQKKGSTATVVQGMEECHIQTAGEGIKLLQNGSHKRQVAATKCNDLSSRSHTVFTVTVYIKRTSEDGEDKLSAGKLNLVDLAGSENIQRSGAENKRAVEAGLINKSLLTLGRVINALVDKGQHIPYRESKLTRLLQDSLGGRTKTCIIATISPAKSNLEETISTLDYAFRAKNIRNKPQVNQLVNKKTLLKEYTSEIVKLKSELIATRQRNGVYLTNDNYEEITVESESRRILSEEQKAKIETMEANLRNKVQELFSLINNFATLKKDNEGVKQALDETTQVLRNTDLVLEHTKRNLADETVLRKAHQATEEELTSKGNELISTLDRTVKDVGGLHAKLKRKSDVRMLNRANWESSQGQVNSVTTLVESKVGDFQEQHRSLLEGLSLRLQEYVHHELQGIEDHQEKLGQSTSDFEELKTEVTEQSEVARNEMNGVLEEIKTLRGEVVDKVGTGLEGLSAAAGRISAGVINELERFHSQVSALCHANTKLKLTRFKLHNSYSSLGRDFKNIFDELVKHINTQKAEAEELRTQLTTATTAAVLADEQMSQKLTACLEEERRQAASDRHNLVAQITHLINATGSTQEDRMTAKIDGLRTEMSNARSQLRSAETSYSNSMDLWSKKETLLVEEVLKSRETLKGKLKTDWTSVNEHNASIQATTRSVHEETVCIVEAQMKDMATQMKALDDFVTRARSQNDAHHTSHVKSLQRLASSVTKAYVQADDSLRSTEGRIHALETDMSGHGDALSNNLPTLASAVMEPLSELRESMQDANMTEYQTTGDTPKKTQYIYPANLPRTAPHDVVLNRPNRALSHSDLPDIVPSPSKAHIFADAPDRDASARPATSDGGLREITTNLAAAPRASEPLISAKEVLSQSLMGPPPFKRHATESKLPKSGKPHRFDGRENERPQFSASVGSGRRLRSSPKG